MLAVLVGAVAGCASFNDATRGLADTLTLYQPEVVQGNFVSKEQVAALQTGMTRLQVRDVLGTPLMTSVFHADRWDYVFTMRRQGVPEQQYRLALFFANDQLTRFEGDEMPSEAEFVERIGRKRTIKVPVLEATEAQLEKFPRPSPADDASNAQRAQSSAPRATAYPPLEPAR